MATIKSYTDLSQSKTLSNILRHESADMVYVHTVDLEGDEHYDIDFRNNQPLFEDDISAWSLAALINVLPKDKSIDCAISFGYYNGKGEYIEKWVCSFEKEGETTDDFIIETTDGDNPIDACYELILKLHEQNLI